MVLLRLGQAHAEEVGPSPPFSPDFVLHDWRAEPLAIGLAALPATSLALKQSHAGLAPDAAHSRPSGPATASNITLVSGIVLGIAGAGLAESARDGAFQAAHLRASLVVGEAILFGTTVTGFPKRAIGRCRPYDWQARTHTCDASVDGDNAFTAMWSGHTATVAAGAGAASCLALRDGHFGWRTTVAITLQAIAGATGVLRVAAGAHSWTDVAVGFGAGNALGAVMCVLHPAARSDVALVPTGRGANLSVPF